MVVAYETGDRDRTGMSDEAGSGLRPVSAATGEGAALQVTGMPVAPAAGRATSFSGITHRALTGLSLVVASAALFFTWRRLFLGVDLGIESYSVLVPWRWALGDRPFVNEQDLRQLPGFLVYPFVKLFGVVRDYDVTGLVLYTRHLYLLLVVGVAVGVFLLVRRLLPWQLAVVVSCLPVTYVYAATPQVTHDALAIAFLTLSIALGSLVVLELGGRRYALAAGISFGLAVVAYPSLLFVVPFWGVLLALAQGRRATGMVAEAAFAHPPDPEGPPTGRPAWLVLRAWVLGGLLVLLPVALVCLSYGPRSLSRSWQVTMAGAHALGQLGGGSKAIQVTTGLWAFFARSPWLLVAALVVYVVYLRWPRLGRALLVLSPAVFWLSTQHRDVGEAGFVFAAALLVPYFYLFLPRERREPGARLLFWAWAPALVAGAMTAYTSAAGPVSAAVGLAPAVVPAAVFLCWALQGVATPRGTTAGGGEVAAGDEWPHAAGALAAPEKPAATHAARASRATSAGLWLATVALVGIVAVTVAFQYQYQQGGLRRAELTSRLTSGPWSGIATTPARKQALDTFAGDLAAQARPGDRLLVFFLGSACYLYWPGPIASNSYRLWPTRDGGLPRTTISYFRRHHVVPSLVVHLTRTAGMTDVELQAASGGLDYPPVLVRPLYAFQRQPADETTAEVLARLPRMEPR